MVTARFLVRVSAGVVALLFAVSLALTDAGAAVEPAWEARPAGYGAGATGGGAATVAWVTTLADSGPGSLRALAEAAGARRIGFHVSGTINLTRDIAVAGDKTIDGRGAHVVVTGRGLVLRQSNVIIRNLELANIAPLDIHQDAIHIDGATRVWIDHCTLAKAGDKLIGVVRGSDITVSWSHLRDQEQVFQIGTYSTATDSGDMRVTVHHSWFDHTGYRNPVVSYGVVHAYNNVVSDWTLYGMRAIRGAQLLSQSNVFVAGTNPRAVLAKGNSTGKDDTPGLVRSTGDLLLNGAKVVQRLPEQVNPPGPLPVPEVADSALRTRVTASAGWRTAALPF